VAGVHKILEFGRKIDLETVVNEVRDFPRLRGVRFELNPFGKSPQSWSGAISACASSRERARWHA